MESAILNRTLAMFDGASCTGTVHTLNEFLYFYWRTCLIPSALVSQSALKTEL